MQSAPADKLYKEWNLNMDKVWNISAETKKI